MTVNLQDKTACVFIPTTWEAEAGESRVQDQPRLQSEALVPPPPQNTKQEGGGEKTKQKYNPTKYSPWLPLVWPCARALTSEGAIVGSLVIWGTHQRSQQLFLWLQISLGDLS